MNVLSSQLTDDRAWAVSQAIENVQENQKYVKSFAGDGMPESITSDYPDIANRTLYIEYATKIITGEYSIDKFDEFVEKWYATGGTEVTEKAREWYAKKSTVIFCKKMRSPESLFPQDSFVETGVQKNAEL